MKMTTKSAVGTSMLALALGLASQVNADEPSYSFDPGVACSFGLDVYVSNCNEHRVLKTFTDGYGNIVRMLSAGKGCDLDYVNTSTDATYWTKADGSVSHTSYNSDGSQTVAATGHNVLVFYPGDIPSGPSTTQYVGRVVYTIDTDGTWILEKVAGRRVDICAALSE